MKKTGGFDIISSERLHPYLKEDVLLYNYLCEKRRRLIWFLSENSILLGIGTFFLGATLIAIALFFAFSNAALFKAELSDSPIIMLFFRIGEVAAMVGFLVFLIEALRGKS